MTQLINGPGIGLPLPSGLYPSYLLNAPYDTPTNRITLAPGDTLPIPAGHFYVNTGNYCVLQYADPVTGTWVMGPNAAWNGGQLFVISDGFNYRVANLLGCPTSAVVAAPGSSYVQATTTITAVGATAGAVSTWVPIVGGLLTASITSVGAGYGVAPEVLIPAPPSGAGAANGVGGIAAHGFCTIASGTLNNSTGFSFTSPGAGYPSAFTLAVQPSPTDPNIATGITLATIVFSVGGTGSLTGALCTNPGAPLSSVTGITLSIGGAGSGASLSANVLQTVTAASVSGAGTGYGTLAAALTTVGGVPATGSIMSAASLGLAWRPRPAQIGLAVTAAGTLGTQVGTIYDGGLFLTSTAPNYLLATQPITASTQAYVGATIALTMGSRPDIVEIQPAP